MSKICADSRGVFITTSARFRPGNVPPYSNDHRMDDGGLAVGDKVKARNVPNTPLVRIMCEDGSVLHWHKSVS